MSVIKINIGGKVFQTTKSTLLNIPLIKNMFESEFKIDKDEDGNI